MTNLLAPLALALLQAAPALPPSFAYRFDEATWVNFKLFGLMGLTLVFALLQGVWIARRAEAHPSTGTQ